MPRAPKPRVRRWTEEDIPTLVACQQQVYDDYEAGTHYDARQLAMQLAAFPEGQLLVEVGDEIVAYATSFIAQLDDEQAYRYPELTGDGTFSTHTPSGDTLYGADIGVLPAYRGQGLTSLLYARRKRLLTRYNLRRMVAYGRIPGFREKAGRLNADEYVQAVVEGRLKDPALSAHLRAGYTVRRVMIDFVQDKASMDYATWLELANPDFRPERRRIAAAPLRKPNRRVRVCCGQWRMEDIADWDAFARSVSFFVRSADAYHSHVLLLPEYFTANLLCLIPRELDDRAAFRALAGMTDRYIELLSDLARKHGLYIIGGSTPTLRGDDLYNVAYLFSPSGNVYHQDKLHITPTERVSFGMVPGESLRLFDTPLGRFGIQICYDVEFPETTRLMALGGMEVLFVPYSTDERKAYHRVRFSAQARAVENYIYVAIAGNVGNLPGSSSYLLNYGRAAILTPSDFAFPANAVEGEADPNTSTVVVAELDLTTLHAQREVGSVRPLYDRRPDLYTLTARTPIEVIQVE